MNCDECDKQEDQGDGEADCDGCEFDRLRRRLSPMQARAWNFYIRTCNPLAREFGLFPLREPMTRDEAEEVYELMAVIDSEIRKAQEDLREARSV